MLKKEIKTKVFDEVNMTHIDSETGEIVSETKDGVKTTIITEKQIEVSDDEYNKELIPFEIDVSFYKVFRGRVKNMRKKLTTTESATLLYLTDYICYDDCVLRRNGEKLGDPLDMKDMAELLEMSYETFRRTLNSLKKKGVIGCHETGVKGKNRKLYTVNPYICCRGNKVQRWIVDFYSETDWAIMEK